LFLSVSFHPVQDLGEELSYGDLEVREEIPKNDDRDELCL